MTGCGSEGPARGADPDSAEQPAATEQQDDSGPNDSGSLSADEDIPYLDRLTPVARLKKATEIRVEGSDAWVTVPVESTSASSMLECLQLLPASKPGEETLTVVFSDGVEELCEWTEE